MMFRYIKHVTNRKKARLDIHKFSLFDIFFIGESQRSLTECVINGISLY